MELEIKSETSSPIKTIEKETKPKIFFSINKLTSSLQLTTDQIFKIFKNNNNDIIENLINTDKNIIEKDNNCRCFSMRNKKMCYSRKCKGCQIISRLIKTNYLQKNEIEIFSGRNKNTFITVKNYMYQSSNYILENNCTNFLIYVSNSLKNIENYEISTVFYKTQDPNYNYIINSIIKNLILKKEKLHLYDNFLWSFVCSSFTTIIRKKATYKNLNDLCKSPYYSNYSSPYLNIEQERKLSKNTVNSIIKQLVYYFNILKDHYFIHGEPSIKYLSFSNEKTIISGETHILKIILDSSPFTSINYQKRRYCFNEERIVNFGIPLENIQVFINGSRNYIDHSKIQRDYDRISILFYKIGNKSNNFIKIRNSYSIPICYKSFDFVCFMISLIKDKYFYSTFSECDNLFTLWKNLWRSDEYPNLMKDIEKMKKNNFVNILNIIRKYYIRFDAIDYFYNELF